MCSASCIAVVRKRHETLAMGLFANRDRDPDWSRAARGCWRSDLDHRAGGVCFAMACAVSRAAVIARCICVASVAG